ncbi:toll/interleukin-1 receptor domain-containing protein [Lentisphaerota bacterium WC36G]|nr:toll/interleukin-1 receptor domain-containing protein [Lentisphaerae bacterium WC36]
MANFSSFISRSQLESVNLNESANLIALNDSADFNRRFSSNYKHVFLSHSHEDKKLAKQLIAFCEKKGISLYVDWQDGELPTTTNVETARKIKEKIRVCDEFWVLATTNALNSRWVPWEVGIADQMKGQNIKVIPIKEYDGSHGGHEYLDLYKNNLGLNTYGNLDYYRWK